jgi:hypothetical protein
MDKFSNSLIGAAVFMVIVVAAIAVGYFVIYTRAD